MASVLVRILNIYPEQTNICDFVNIGITLETAYTL